MAAMGYGALAGVSTFASSYAESQAFKAQKSFQEFQAEAEDRINDMRQADVLRQGDKAVEAHKKQVKSLIGSQQVAYAAANVELNSGSALDVLLDTEKQAELDTLTIKNNSIREAWGYKVQGAQNRLQGRLNSLSLQNQARNSLIAGGVKAADSALSSYGTIRNLGES